jgi:hydrogenase maturation factor
MSVDPHHCITCSDEGAELTVLEVDERRALALCSSAGGEHSAVEIALIDDVRAGDTLLVHAGTALLRVAEATA